MIDGRSVNSNAVDCRFLCRASDDRPSLAYGSGHGRSWRHLDRPFYRSCPLTEAFQTSERGRERHTLPH